MESKKPNLSTGLSEKKCSCGGNCKMRPQNGKVNTQEQLMLVEARGRYPLGGAWRLFVTATSLRHVLELFEDDGLSSVRPVASTVGTATRGQQNNGVPALLLLDTCDSEGVGHE